MPFSLVTLEDVRQRMQEFASARDWDQFHTPRNLALALVGEVGELCEIFQWRGDSKVAPGLPGACPRHLQDVLDSSKAAFSASNT